MIASLSSGQASFGSAICAICHASETGEELSPEIQDALENNVRLTSGFMAPQAAVVPSTKDVPPDPIDGTTRRGGLGISGWVRVIKAAVFGQPKTDKTKTQKPPSKQAADSKKRSRVFAVEDIESAVIDRKNTPLD